MTSSILITFLLICLYDVSTINGQCHQPGSTPKIRDIILGRCQEYRTVHNAREDCAHTGDLECSQLTDLAMSAFMYQPSCNISFSRYEPFMNAANVEVHQAMFWSGVYGFVHIYTSKGLRATTLEDTLIGYMMDGLRFCGQLQAPGITFGRTCSGFSGTDDCPLNAEYSFWAMASKHFAENARGDIRVMLNASYSEAFRDKSFFATWEVPNLNENLVTNVHLLLVQTPGQRVRSTCSSENIVKLRGILNAKHIKSSCEDNPSGPRAMLCVDAMNQEECIFGPRRTVNSAKGIRAFAMHYWITSILFIICSKF